MNIAREAPFFTRVPFILTFGLRISEPAKGAVNREREEKIKAAKRADGRKSHDLFMHALLTYLF